MDPVDPLNHPDENGDHPIIYWRTAAFILAVLIFIGVGGYLWDRGHQTEKAVYTSCVLQNNQQIQAQTGRPAYLILVREVLNNADEDGRPQVRKDFNTEAKKLLGIDLANCRQVAKHPEDVKVKQLKPYPGGRVRTTP